MILQALVKQYENLAADNRVSREGWCEAKVSYAIDLASDGTVRGFINLKKEEERGKKRQIFYVIIPNICWVWIKMEAQNECWIVFRSRKKSI